MRKVRGIWILGAAAAAPAAMVAAADASPSVIEEVRIVGQRAEARQLSGSAHAIDAAELRQFSQTDINRVLLDEIEGGRLVGARFMQAGLSRPAHITGSLRTTRNRRRRRKRGGRGSVMGRRRTRTKR